LLPILKRQGEYHPHDLKFQGLANLFYHGGTEEMQRFTEVKVSGSQISQITTDLGEQGINL